jgi:putative acyl-CoA dehydrogenase
MTGFLDASIHEVFNQSPPFADVNLFTSDAALREAVRRERAGWAEAGLAAFGARCGSAEALALGRQANEHPPELKTCDEKGRRLDVVEFHPAYHQLMAMSFVQGLHASPWSDPRPGAHVARCAGSFMAAQMESGHCCPVTMTHASMATLRLAPELAADWTPKLFGRDYDPSFRPVAEKRSATIGMGMTERQGGADVRANITRAEPSGGGAYRVTGHKWFMSAPMCDAFLILAQAPGGLTCLFLPRFLPDGQVNAIHFQRLKNKLGNRSNASAEAEFWGAEAQLVGEEGRGVRAIIEMVTLTRLDCAVSSAGLMRLALASALRHAAGRSAFQRRLIDQPLMRSVLADMAIECEAATALAFRLARSFDLAEMSAAEAAFRRLMTPVAKYAICKSAPGLICEAMECLGGNGYVEDGLLARAYREAPVNAIWEGPGNIMALDVLRVMQREPGAVELALGEFESASLGEPRLRAALDRLKALLADRASLEANARQAVELLARIASAGVLLAGAPDAVAGAYVHSRLADGLGGAAYGARTAGVDAGAILSRQAQAD